MDNGNLSSMSRYYRHIISNLVCLGRHTISKLICTSGCDQKDWSADYKLYSKNRVNHKEVFKTVVHSICKNQKKNEPLIIAMDDTLLRKTGKKIPTTKYLRDPLGPPFQVNLVRGQRFIQLSAASKQKDNSARMIPIAFENAPAATKPKKNAPAQAWDLYKKEIKIKNLSTYGYGIVDNIRKEMVESGNRRPLWVSVDGSYTNKTILRNIDHNVTLIGRIRADAKLYYLPQCNDSVNKGRIRTYGGQAPTPEQLRQDANVPWINAVAHAAGKMHSFKIKTIENVKWRTAGKAHTLRLIVIAPLGYRLTKGGRILYRDPAYIICTDPTIPIQEVLQAYLWRWGIEVNFRDEKTLLGVGQAQIRNENSVSTVPQMMVAGYAALLLAGEKAFAHSTKNVWRPKWNKKDEMDKLTTNDYLRQLRCDLWGRGLDQAYCSDFLDVNNTNTKHEKSAITANSALIAASW